MLPAYTDVREAISSSFDQLEDLRIRLVDARRTLRLIFIGIAVLNIICFIYVPNFVPLAFAALIVMAILYWVRRKKAISQYRTAYKQQIVAPLIQKMAELCRLPHETDQYAYACNYYPTDRIEDDLIERSRLFPYRVARIQGEDLFVGKLGLTSYKFSEIKLIQEDIDGEDGMTQETTMFQGVLFVADFRRNFEGYTVLTGNLSSSNSRRGKLMTQISKKLLERRDRIANQIIKLENDRFNDAFQVRSSHEEETRRILSPGMAERLLEFKNRSSSGRYAPIQISFVDSYMFVSIWNHKDQFEADLDHIINDHVVEEIYQEICFYLGLIEHFDLNAGSVWHQER